MYGGVKGTDFYPNIQQKQLLGLPIKPEHEEPLLMAEGRWLFALWETLHAGRGGSGFGPSPLQFSEIRAYCDLTEVRLNHWALFLLREIDNLWLRSWVRHNSPEEEKPEE